MAPPDRLQFSWTSRALTPDGLQAFAAEDGIVPLSSIANQASAADRLRSLLAAAYGNEWCAAKLAELLGEALATEELAAGHFLRSITRSSISVHLCGYVWDGRKGWFLTRW